ncbi:MAG: alkaline shock response membrane anchor protein AmaP [Bacillota bacterium]
MKGTARLILILIGLLLAAGGLYLLALGLELVAGYGTILTRALDKPVLMALGAGLLLVALIFLSLGMRSPRKIVPDTVLQTSEFGEIRIAVVAIENMVLRVVQQTQGLKDNGRKVAYTPDGLLIHVRVKVMPDLELPALIGELQAKVKNYVEDVTGIIVHEVKVLVENIILDQVPLKKR